MPKDVEEWIQRHNLDQEQTTTFEAMLEKAREEFGQLIKDQIGLTRLATQWNIPADQALLMQPDDMLKVITLLAMLCQ